ncbi:MAG: hypothetical protein KAT15_11550, partial [Bacteroidales bacterium]|nr:hypothetical protein [Bacteroidales bacterium]
MKPSRRVFLKSATSGALGSGMIFQGCNPAGTPETTVNYSALDKELGRPVLKAGLFPDPVIIDRLELLRFNDNFICRVTSKDGAEGISVGNNAQLASLYPVFTNRLQPFFPGKDARDWESLLEKVYVYKSNYKLQNLALWVPLATIEFAILDMLGKIIGKPIGDLIGSVHHPQIAVYQANNFR